MLSDVWTRFSRLPFTSGSMPTDAVAALYWLVNTLKTAVAASANTGPAGSSLACARIQPSRSAGSVVPRDADEAASHPDELALAHACFLGRRRRLVALSGTWRPCMNGSGTCGTHEADRPPLLPCLHRWRSRRCRARPASARSECRRPTDSGAGRLHLRRRLTGRARATLAARASGRVVLFLRIMLGESPWGRERPVSRSP